ncbi:glycosyltransferase [Streptococcus suis]|uniref:glycosyltransferase n=1 Tax=Streptococcus suis TaxID=1307 RepID=UPI000CF672B0|nr:glycosyltransferase [Streptococcus suis]
MIFVTVGTHEQSFNRLIERIDNLKKNKIIKDDVFIQIGFSTYEPEYCDWKRMLSYEEMEEYFSQADTVVSHGGPATFMAALSKGKVPIVVPRLEKFGEHVNNHQLEFVKKIVDKEYSLIVIENIAELDIALQNKSKYSNKGGNNKYFCERFSAEINKLMQ